MYVSSLPRQGAVSERPVRLHKLLVSASLFAAAAVIGGCATVSAGNNSAAASPTAAISIVPATVDFREVVVGQKNSQTLRISNVGKQPISFDALNVVGQGFTLASGQAPASLAPGASFTVTLAFAPTVASTLSGSFAVSSSELKTPVSVPLEGTGEKPAPQLQVTPPSLNFGNTTIHTSSWQNATITNTGNLTLTINSVAVSNPAFLISGLSSGTNLAPGQSSEFKLGFQPAAAGSATATLSVNSASLTSPLKLSISGAGVNANTSSPSSSGSTAPATSHVVKLTWNASPSAVLGYEVYRSTTAGGPFTRLTLGLVSALDFSDQSVQPGRQYFYVVTAINATGAESAYSNEVSVSVPTP
jgi:Transmembrane protein 131-like N-terminal/Abnormal spindle-like microcephaly-assoc'd, ASPM-SPD-2-Hydin